MQFTGKLVQVLPAQTGQGKNGEWKKQEIILETDGQYPKKVCISVWGDRMSHLSLTPGEMLSVDFDIESREYNGKWYTDVKAWKVTTAVGGPTPSGGGQPYSGGQSNSGYPQANNLGPAKKIDSGFPSSPPAGADSFEDDLPF